MDVWFHKNLKLEKEFQQVVVQENNSGSPAKETDYYIADIEYALSENKSHIDSLGIKINKNNEASLALLEMKYGDGALAGESGVVAHIKDINELFKDLNKKEMLYNDAERVINQKV